MFDVAVINALEQHELHPHKTANLVNAGCALILQRPASPSVSFPAALLLLRHNTIEIRPTINPAVAPTAPPMDLGRGNETSPVPGHIQIPGRGQHVSTQESGRSGRCPQSSGFRKEAPADVPDVPGRTCGDSERPPGELRGRALPSGDGTLRVGSCS